MSALMFGVIYLFTLMLAVSHRVIPNRFFFLIWFSVMIFLSLSLRLNFMPDPESDMGSYAMNMTITEYIPTYHAREFIFWLGSRYLYQILGDPGLVFIVMDIILFLFFYHGVRLNKNFFKEHINVGNLKYLFFGAFIFFPYYNGMINSYRQVLATCIVLCALGYAYEKPRRGSALLLTSFFVHNVMIVLLPVFILVRNGRHSDVMAIISSAVVFLAMYLIANTTILGIGNYGGVEIGQRIGLIYLFVIVFIGMFIVSFEFSFRKAMSSLLFKVLAYFISLYWFSFIAFPTQGAERVLYLIMAILYPILGFYLEVVFKSGYLVRLVYAHIALAPMFYFVLM